MISSISQPLVIDETQNIIKIKNTRCEEMTKSFSTLHAGVFCLVWKDKKQINSIWSAGLDNLVKLYFKFNKKQELIYFPPEGSVIKIFGRRS